MTANNHDLIVRLQRRLTELGDGRDFNAHAASRTDYDSTQRILSNLLNLPADVAAQERRLAEFAAAVDKRSELEQSLLNAPDWSTMADARDRDREYERQRHLRLQVERLHEGTLLRTSTDVYPRLKDIDVRIAEITDRRDRARRALENYIAAAEELLGFRKTALGEG